MTTKVDFTVIGSGPAGLQTALYAASEGFNTLVLEKDAIGGQIRQTPRLENFAGQPGIGISGPRFVDSMRRQVVNMNGNFRIAEADIITRSRRYIDVRLVGGDVVRSKIVVIATGARWNKLQVPGENESANVHRLFYGPFRCSHVEQNGIYTVVGAGNSSAQGILELAKHATRVNVIVRSKVKWSKYLDNRIRNHKNIHLWYGVDIMDCDLGCMHLCYSTGRRIFLRANYSFVCAGQTPNSDFARNSGIALDDKGFILGGFGLNSQTSMPGVFVAGDVKAGNRRRSVGGAIGGANEAIYDVYRFMEGGQSVASNSH